MNIKYVVELLESRMEGLIDGLKNDIQNGEEYIYTFSDYDDGYKDGQEIRESLIKSTRHTLLKELQNIFKFLDEDDPRDREIIEGLMKLK